MYVGHDETLLKIRVYFPGRLWSLCALLQIQKNRGLSTQYLCNKP